MYTIRSAGICCANQPKTSETQHMDSYMKRLKGDGWQHEGLKFNKLQDLCAHFGADYNRVYYAIARKRNVTLADALRLHPYERQPPDAESAALRAIREVPIVDGDRRECIKNIGRVVARYLKENPDVQNQS